MKKVSTIALFTMWLIMFLAMPNKVLAQAGDTVVVNANPVGGPFINEFIMGDTTASGARNNPNRVYVLQQTGPIDTVYFYNATMLNTDFNITIVGKVNPTTGKPPVVAPYKNPDNSIPAPFIQPIHGTITFKGVYFISVSPDSVVKSSDFVDAKGDSITFRADKCVFDRMGAVISFYGNNNKLFFTNCVFQNMNGQWWQGGSAAWCQSGVPLDTAIIENNTFFCLSRSVIGSPGYVNYILLNHNTIYDGTGGPFLINQLTNAVVTNNIWYGLLSRGGDSTMIKNKNFNYAKQGPAIFFADTLTTLLNPPYNFTESERKVVLKNNAYYWPKAITNFFTNYNDTSTVKKLIQPYWMNEQTVKEFTDHTRWPGFVESNNTEADPQFDQSMDAAAADSLAKFVGLVWQNGNGGNFRYAQMAAASPFEVAGLVPSTWHDWIGYPVPENMRYNNVAMQSAGTDGKALGDLNWFPEQLTSVKQIPNTIPSKFELSQNYPNPFNPTTMINYALPKSGFVTLKVYNILGQEVETLHNGFQKAGSYKVNFNASKLASGVYLYNLNADGFTLTKKMLLLK